MTNFNNNTFEAKEHDEEHEPEQNTLKQSLEGSDTLKNFFTDWNPTLQIALEKIARGHNVTFDTALAAFLGMCSVAIGGNKTIVSGDWEEKALLWLAFHAPTGKGKTPLLWDCGRGVLAKRNSELFDDYTEQQASLERWNETPNEIRDERPEVSARMIWVTYTTLEKLTDSLLNNPTGIGLLHDELDALISGRNQYKGKGDDAPKLLELWNGREISNPTMNSYRYITDSFVPIIGGIQTDLLKKIFNPEDIANGFVARFLLVPFRHPTPPLIDSERKIIRDNISKQERNSINLIIKQLIDQREIKEQFSFDKDAEDLIYQQHDKFTKESNKKLQEMYSSFQKLKNYCLRISLLIHCIKGETGPVSVNTVSEAITLNQWFCSNMQSAFIETYLCEHDQTLSKVFTRLSEAHIPLSVDNIYQGLRKSVKGNSDIRKQITLLQESGLIDEIKGPKGGKKYIAKPTL